MPHDCRLFPTRRPQAFCSNALDRLSAIDARDPCTLSVISIAIILWISGDLCVVHIAYTCKYYPNVQIGIFLRSWQGIRLNDLFDISHC